jgi:DNA-binding Lrp family transcriptional regulator
MSEPQEDYITEAMEMIGINLSEPKQIIQEISGFTPIFDAVVSHYKDETRAAVHGAMWRFCQMQDGVCRASLSTIAEILGISSATVMRHAEVLCKDGYFTDLTPDLKNRPHVYADTGRVVMKSKINAGISQRNTSISQCNVGVSESQLSKVLKKEKKDGANAPISLTESEKQEANHKVDTLLEFERQAKEHKEQGKGWRGREHLRPELLHYGDFWHKLTGLEMYGVKSKPKADGEWLRSFQVWWENELTESELGEAYVTETWGGRRAISKPSQITGTAKAIHATGRRQAQTTPPTKIDASGFPESY